MKQTIDSTGALKKTTSWNNAAFGFGRDDGFSLIELGIGLLVAIMLCGFALVQMNDIMPGINANKAMYAAVAQLRQGRELAIAQRRSINLLFVGEDQIGLVRNELPDGEQAFSTIYLGNGCKFMQFDEITQDTPDTFGNTAAIDFGGAQELTFLSDGTLVDELGSPVSGTVFIGLTNHPEVARAVTVLGATGRVRGYRWDGSKWIQ
jgi:Tfp pilus assembly protein FimT